MIYQMYSVHDTAVKIFLPPVFARTHGEAERQFAWNVNNKDNGHLFNSPSNFALFHIGTYNDETGQCTSVAPTVIISGIQAKNHREDPDGQMRVAGT